MSRYIDADALTAEFKRLTLGENSLIERVFADGVYAVIDTFPTADVVEVVRCKDCKHCEQSYLYKEKGKEPKLEYTCCAFGNVSPDFYCGIGERRGE